MRRYDVAACCAPLFAAVMMPTRCFAMPRYTRFTPAQRIDIDAALRDACCARPAARYDTCAPFYFADAAMMLTQTRPILPIAGVFAAIIADA